MPTRRKLTILSLLILSGTFGVGLMTHAGCQGRPPITGTIESNESRSRKLIALAVEEAAQIPDVDARLTRQLNLTDQQITHGWHRDARRTLAEANATLVGDEAAKLNEHARIAGWISISELARRSNDAVIAADACDRAVAALLAIEAPAERCQYVMGVANELQYTRGAVHAADLLERAGGWSRDIDNKVQRRHALVSFASALFNLDQYEAGQQVLRQDDDPAWRSDKLLALASRPGRASGYSDLADAPASAYKQGESESFYGRKVDFRSVFQGKQQSQTTSGDR